MIFNPVFGGAAPVLGAKTITANGTYNASSDNLDGYDEVTANVPNTYAAGDEGKVVSNGALVAQSSENITQNGTYDTTLKNQVIVNVSGGGSTLITKNITANGTYNASADNADGYSQVIVNVPSSGLLPSGYTRVAYLESSGTQAILTGVVPYQNLQIDTCLQWLGTAVSGANNDILIGCRSQSSGGTYRFVPIAISTASGGVVKFRGNIGSAEYIPYANTIDTKNFNTLKFNTANSKIIYNGTTLSFSTAGQSFNTKNDVKIALFAAGDDNSSFSYPGICRIMYCKLFNRQTGVVDRDLIPCVRNSDSVAGMYDIENDVFYTNIGTGSFIVGPVIQ